MSLSDILAFQAHFVSLKETLKNYVAQEIARVERTVEHDVAGNLG